MGETIALRAADGHGLSAYHALPAGDVPVRGRLVVVQEIFGVNGHMRSVCDAFAAAGYEAVCPALFDRVARGVELGYGKPDVARGLDLRSGIAEEEVLADIAAAAAVLGAGPKGIVGYCWGGTIAWWGATRTDLFAAASGWYGGGIAATREAAPKCPVQLHFGEVDPGIPLSDVDTIRAARPEVEVFVYPGAGHGFGCGARASYEPSSAALAQQRTIDFFAKHLAA